MGSLDWILEQLDERIVAERIAIPHDEARASFSTGKNTVDSIEEFDDVIGRYYSHHFTECVSSGGWLSDTDAQGEAKEILERRYGKRGKGYMAALADAQHGTNGGLRYVLDVLADELKRQAVERHIRTYYSPLGRHS